MTEGGRSALIGIRFADTWACNCNCGGGKNHRFFLELGEGNKISVSFFSNAS